MNLDIVDVKCPICDSSNVRSKVRLDDVWYYICDNQVEHRLMINGEEVNMTDRFYFNEDGSKLEYQGVKYTRE